jgi:hypothetical protein
MFEDTEVIISEDISTPTKLVKAIERVMELDNDRQGYDHQYNLERFSGRIVGNAACLIIISRLANDVSASIALEHRVAEVLRMDWNRPKHLEVYRSKANEDIDQLRMKLIVYTFNSCGEPLIDLG